MDLRLGSTTAGTRTALTTALTGRQHCSALCESGEAGLFGRNASEFVTTLRLASAYLVSTVFSQETLASSQLIRSLVELPGNIWSLKEAHNSKKLSGPFCLSQSPCVSSRYRCITRGHTISQHSGLSLRSGIYPHIHYISHIGVVYEITISTSTVYPCVRSKLLQVIAIPGGAAPSNPRSFCTSPEHRIGRRTTRWENPRSCIHGCHWTHRLF